MRHLLVMTLAFALFAPPANAQQRPRSDSLPRDLVIALLGGSLGNRNIEIHAGMADDSLPADLFRDALILGYADYRVSRISVAYFPYDPKITLDTIKARLLSKGWTLTPEDSSAGRGFVSTYGGSRPLAICRDKMAIVPTMMIRSLNRTLVVINRQGSQGVEFLCGRRPEIDRMRQMRGADDTPLPALTPPPGMDSRGGGSSGIASQERAMSMSTSLNGMLPLKQILAHYSELFIKGGWKKVEEQAATSIGIMTFEITSKGQAWHCAFIVSMPATDAADVQLMLRMK
ncbi:MAG TPA: hypothetical protein VFD64_08240 [Gemmatimonadaceae bacterium]|nr:hypothetical protein [Gemmatimonadaceae bacterium]